MTAFLKWLVERNNKMGLIRKIAANTGWRRRLAVNISTDDIEEIFKYFPRKRWKSLINPLICKVNKKSRVSYVYDEVKRVKYPFIDTCYFELDNLAPDWTCPHDVGDYVTHKEIGGIFYIKYVGALDSRYPGTPREMVEYGNLYTVIGFSDDGRLIATNDADRDLNDGNSGYHMFEAIERPDIKPGEFFYYVEMQQNGLLRQINEELPFENYIYENKIKLKLGDTSHKEEYDRFFKAVEKPEEHDGSVN